MERRFLLTMEHLKRHKILTDCIEGRMTMKQAAVLLGISYRQVLRLKKRLIASGIEGLLRIKRSSYKGVKKEVKRRICGLYKSRYNEFNILHFKDKLQEFHDIFLSYETIRQILIKGGLYKPKRRKKTHRKRRMRMPKAGMMIQMDSSYHHWINGVKKRWWLIAMIDDATSKVPYAYFYPKDTTFANMNVIRRCIEKKGVFMSLYADKASHFKTTRHGGVHYDTSPEQQDSQIERALEELGITLIPANSPQAKGRIERLFGFLQDRLIKEMRLVGIKTYEQANRFLVDKFLPWYNSKYTRQAESAFRPLTEGEDLDLIFCKKYVRRVNKDNTVRICGETIQIPPSKIKLSFLNTKVDVCLLPDGRVWIVYRGKIVAKDRLSATNKIFKRELKIEKLLNQREYEKVLVVV